MQEAIQPRQIGSVTHLNERYAFIIDSEDFISGTEHAIQAASGNRQQENHALEHLIEVAKTSPEICVILDRRGNMSAWGLENVGCKARKTTDKFNVAYVENVNLSFLPDVKQNEDNVLFLDFFLHKSATPLILLVHHFDGRIVWFESKLDELFDPSPRQQRLHVKALWSGHDGPVKKIVRSGSGKALVSRTNDNEGLIWKQASDRSGMALRRSSSLSCPEHVHRSCLLREGDYVINLHHHSISLWDARSPVAEQVVLCPFEAAGKPLCLLPLPHSNRHSSARYLASITSKMEAIVWEVRLPAGSQQNQNGHLSASMRHFCSSDLGLQDDLVFILPVDPAGSRPVAPGFLDTFAKDLAISYTNNGMLRAWTATLDVANRSANWLVTSTIESDIDSPSLASASSTRKIAVVDRAKTGLTIWDLWSAQLEYTAIYEASDTIQDLDWSSTPDDQSILAVGFPYKVVILAQMRYDYLNAGPAWAPIREIRIKELTSHPIGDSTWLGSGNLVIGAGNQLYVYDKDVATSDDMVVDLSVPVHQHRFLSIFDLVTYLNGPLPVFHPQFLAQCILAGKLVQVQRVIIGLFKALKFFVPGDDLDSFVSLSPIDFYSEQEVRYITSYNSNIRLTTIGFLFCCEEGDAVVLHGFHG
jgi:WD40 repeat protein